MVTSKNKWSRFDNQLQQDPSTGTHPTPEDRVVGVTYQNTTGRSLMIIVGIQLIRVAIGNAQGLLQVGTVNPPLPVDTAGTAYFTTGVAGTFEIISSLVAIVPPNFFYRVVQINATVLIDSWTEIPI